VQIDIDLPEVFAPLFKSVRYKVFYGGRGGGKSWAFAIALLVMGYKKPIRVLCARELQVSIADSVHKLLSDIILNIPEFRSFYKITSKTIEGVNGTEFAFKGLKHNITEIKSYEGVDYVWVEEAQAVSNKSWETLIPTIRKTGSEIWISFNPKNATDPTWTRFIVNADEDTLVQKVGWQDNPFFTDVLEKERLKLLRDDPVAYKHVYEGEFDTRYSGCVYAKFIAHNKISPLVKHDPNYPVYTAWDKGYGDSTSIVFYQIGNNEIFIIDFFEDNQEDVRYYCEVLYGRELVVNERDLQTGEVLDWSFGKDLPEHAHRKEYTYHPGGHFVPHDASIKLMEAGGRSMVAQAKKFGVNMAIIPATSHINSEEALRTTLPKCWINTERCKDLVHALSHYHYEYDEDRQRYSKLPYHDWSSNPCDAAEIMARTWQETAISVKELDRRKLVSDFHKKRTENKLVQENPYRLR